MTTIIIANEHDIDYEATAFAKKGSHFYSVGLSEPGTVTIAHSVNVGDDEHPMHEPINAYPFPQTDMDAAVASFFEERKLSDNGLMDRVKEIANQYFASEPALEILIAMPVAATEDGPEVPPIEEPAPEEPTEIILVQDQPQEPSEPAQP